MDNREQTILRLSNSIRLGHQFPQQLISAQPHHDVLCSECNKYCGPIRASRSDNGVVCGKQVWICAEHAMIVIGVYDVEVCRKLLGLHMLACNLEESDDEACLCVVCEELTFTADICEYGWAICCDCYEKARVVVVETESVINNEIAYKIWLCKQAHVLVDDIWPAICSAWKATVDTLAVAIERTKSSFCAVETECAACKMRTWTALPSADLGAS